MNTPDIITWLRDQAKRVPEEVHKRGMIEAADTLEELTRKNTEFYKLIGQQGAALDNRDRIIKELQEKNDAATYHGYSIRELAAIANLLAKGRVTVDQLHRFTDNFAWMYQFVCDNHRMEIQQAVDGMTLRVNRPTMVEVFNANEQRRFTELNIAKEGE